jgi:hypothetical protein
MDGPDLGFRNPVRTAEIESGGFRGRVGGASLYLLKYSVDFLLCKLTIHGFAEA